MSNSLFISIKNKWNNPEFQKYFKNTLWLFSEKFIRLGVSFFVGVLVARYLGPKNFGILSYAQSIVMLVTPIANLGIDNILVRELVKNKNLKKERIILGTALLLKLVTSTILIIIFALLYYFEKNPLNRYIYIIVVILLVGLFFRSFDIIDFYFQAKVISKLSFIGNIISLIFSNIVRFIFVIKKFSLKFIAFSYALEGILLALFSITIYNKYSENKIYKWEVNLNLAKFFLKNSYPLMISVFAVSLYFRLDQIMLKNLLNNMKIIGEYSAAVKIVELIYIIPTVILNSMFPFFIKLKTRSNLLYKKYFKITYNLFYVFSIICVLILNFGATIIVKIIYGNKFINASEILKILSFNIIFVSFGMIHSKWLIIKHLEKKNMYSTLLALLTNLILNYYLIKSYGVRGAAIATLVSTIVSSIIYDLIDKDLHETFKLKIRVIFFFDIIEYVVKLLKTKMFLRYKI